MLQLQEQVAELLSALDAKTSAYARHLRSNKEVAVRSNDPVDTLSVIKIPILIRAFKDVQSNRLTLDDRGIIGPQDRRKGTGALKNFDPGLKPTYRDLLTQMIITSDNTATDMVIDKVGFGRINTFLSESGYTQTRIQHTLADYFRRRWELLDSNNASLSNAEVFELGFPRDENAYERDFIFVGQPTEWLGCSTAREMSDIIAQIQNAEFVDRQLSDQMLDILKKQTYNSRLPQRIGDKIPIGHKTGDWAPYAGNDVGIIYANSGPIVVSIFVNQNRSDFSNVEATHGHIAELLLKTWG